MFQKDSMTTRREFVKRVGAAAGATLILGRVRSLPMLKASSRDATSRIGSRNQRLARPWGVGGCLELEPGDPIAPEPGV